MPVVKKLEIERKFLLKGMPHESPSDIIDINQWYWKNKNGIWERARSWDSTSTGLKWIHTIKTPISKGIQEEVENDLTEKEFNQFVRICRLKNEEAKFITKQRWIYPVEKGLYWEVDMFGYDHHLIVAEIELPKKNAKFITPDFINDKILMEVTGMKQFSNRSLSDKLIK